MRVLRLIVAVHIGIPESELERVLERFTLLDNTLSRRCPVAGFGLHIVRAMISGHDGTLTLRNQLQGGTIAEARLPELRLTMPKVSVVPEGPI